MAVSLDTLLGGSTRNMGAVNSTVKNYALEVVRRAHKQGIKVIITSGLRTMEEQARLYGQGRSSYLYRGKQYGNPKKNVVTQAKPGQSVHNYGYAVDFALMLDNGAVVWDMNRDDNKKNGSDWREVASIAKQLGFSWGGDWKSFKDYPHIDYGGLTWQQLQAGKRPTIKPLANATPTKPSNIIMHGDAGANVTTLQKNLNTIGIKVSVDGIFGDGTEAAVKIFQSRTGLKKDGIYGPTSIEKMKVLLSREIAAKPAKKEEEDKLELSKAQRKEMAAIFAKAREKGIFSSAEHEKDIVEGTMTISKFTYLNGVIAGAAINDDKRIKS